MLPMPSTLLASRTRAGLALCTLVWTSACVTTKAPRDTSAVQLVGGQEIPAQRHPAVVEIEADHGEAMSESCTATFIAPRVLLTAGHCVWRQSGDAPGPGRETSLGDFDPTNPLDDLLAGRRNRGNPFRDEIDAMRKTPGARSISWKRSMAEGGPVSSRCFVIPHGWGLESGGAGTRHDLALVFLEADAAPATIGLYQGGRAKGMEVTYVGYGWSRAMGVDSHVKREGRNSIAAVTSEGVIVSYAPSRPEDPAKGAVAMMRDGDSGGPMLIGDQVAAVASALLYHASRRICPEGADPASCRDELVDIGYHVDLNAPATRAFIERALGDFAAGKIDPKRPEATCSPRDKSEFIARIRQNP